MSAIVKDIPEIREVVFGVGTPYEATANWKEAQATGFAFAVTLKFKNPKLNVRDEGWPVPEVKRIDKIQAHVRQYWARMCEIFKNVQIKGKHAEVYIVTRPDQDKSLGTSRDMEFARQHAEEYIGKWIAVVDGTLLASALKREALLKTPFVINATLIAYVSAR